MKKDNVKPIEYLKEELPALCKEFPYSFTESQDFESKVLAKIYAPYGSTMAIITEAMRVEETDDYFLYGYFRELCNSWTWKLCTFNQLTEEEGLVYITYPEGKKVHWCLSEMRAWPW